MAEPANDRPGPRGLGIDGADPLEAGGEALPPPDAGFDEEFEDRSLLDGIEALIDDGKTYLEAEFAFQKSRIAFVADRAKSALVFGAVALLLGFLALIGLTVGAIIALAPLITPWGAAALVVLSLTLAAGLAARAAARRWASLLSMIEPSRGDPE